MDADVARRLASSLRQGRSGGSVVQIVAATPGEGTSSLAREIVLAAAASGARTVLVDLGRPVGSQIELLAAHFVTPPVPAGAVSLGGGEIRMQRFGTDGPHAVVIDTAADTAAPAAWAALFDGLRSDFDLAVIDSAPFGLAPDCVARAPLVQTNLIVVRAEETRIAIAQNLRDRLLEAGGSIAGVLFNRRRLQVPAMLYRRL